MIESGRDLSGRLERYRASIRPPTTPGLPHRPAPAGASASDLADRLAVALDGEVMISAEGSIVRCEGAARRLDVDRARLATLPGQPAADIPLIFLDTETTGLATAAGTIAFLIGLGWWEADRFRQVQLLLPDQGEERALLTALEATIPTRSWLVTYNGRSFDWPLIVARYRMARRSPPIHAGHLDLLPIVRRLFRHRMPDARLQTAEAEVLGLRRIGDVGGWEIPGRYLEFLRGGSAAGLVEVVRHNDQDVRSMAQLLAHLADGLADPGQRRTAPPGDLAGLSRAYAREHRLREALACLDAVGDRPLNAGAASRTAPRPIPQLPVSTMDDAPWWSPRRPADFGGRTNRGTGTRSAGHSRLDTVWTDERIAIDRAHILRRLGRPAEAARIWEGLATGPGRTAIQATIELAKIHEHRLRDRPTALAVALSGLDLLERRRRMGRYEPTMEADLRRRVSRLSSSPVRPGAGRIRDQASPGGRASRA
jgi:hypothetical protein